MQEAGLLVWSGNVCLGWGSGHRTGVEQELYGQGKTGHTPAINPTICMQTSSSPFTLVEVFLPDDITVPANNLGRVVKTEQDVMAGVSIREIRGQIQSLSGHFEHEGNDVGQELGVGKTEVEGEKFPTNGKMGVLRIVAAGVNPVVFIGSSQQLKLFEDELELPCVGDK